jgi:hypothetical protein
LRARLGDAIPDRDGERRPARRFVRRLRLNLSGYFDIAVICIGIALLTGLISRTIVYRHLRELG